MGPILGCMAWNTLMKKAWRVWTLLKALESSIWVWPEMASVVLASTDPLRWVSQPGRRFEGYFGNMTCQKFMRNHRFVVLWKCQRTNSTQMWSLPACRLLDAEHKVLWCGFFPVVAEGPCHWVSGIKLSGSEIVVWITRNAQAFSF